MVRTVNTVKQFPITGVFCCLTKKLSSMISGLRRCTTYEVAHYNPGRALIYFDTISKGLKTRSGYINFEFYVYTNGDARIHFTPDNAGFDHRSDYIIGIH